MLAKILIVKTSENWYLDSGCSNHMAKDASIFKDIDESVKVIVQIGNDTVIESKGKGTVMVETKKGTRLITNVLLVPNLKENLLSIGQMMEKGYTLHFEGDTCKIYDNKKLEIGRVKMENRNRRSRRLMALASKIWPLTTRKL
uniref:Retrovirus-related Pol polyprotein from transposon TNT 1-94-like beta-barrel domain-containing protein n=2 Tax=Cajanus cajan TaxID=3821 RepID=A0A151R2T4_CAJCA|nr:hypothetical protein KK1_042050 [Cajanus cajan]